MKLYDNMIDVTMDALSHSEGKRVTAASASAWKCLDNSEFIMQRDAGLELGSAPEPSVNSRSIFVRILILQIKVSLFLFRKN